MQSMIAHMSFFPHVHSIDVALCLTVGIVATAVILWRARNRKG